MKSRFTIIVSIAAILAGFLLGYFARSLVVGAPKPAAKEEKEKTSEKRADRNRPQSDHEADLNRLRARIAKLEEEKSDLTKQLARQDTSPSAEERIDGAPTNRVDRPPFGRPPSVAEMRAHFEEMREKDPKRYAEITNNIARWQARRQERLQNQFDILANADTAHMTKAQRKVHEEYQNLLAREEKLREQMNPNNADVTDEQREAAFKELREIGGKLHDLRRAERETLLTQTVNSLGYSGEDANVVVDEIKAVYEATGGGGHHGPPPGGPGGWGRPGGGRRGRR